MEIEEFITKVKEITSPSKEVLDRMNERPDELNVRLAALYVKLDLESQERYRTKLVDNMVETFRPFMQAMAEKLAPQTGVAYRRVVPANPTMINPINGINT